MLTPEEIEERWLQNASILSPSARESMLAQQIAENAAKSRYADALRALAAVEYAPPYNELLDIRECAACGAQEGRGHAEDCLVGLTLYPKTCRECKTKRALWNAHAQSGELICMDCLAKRDGIKIEDPEYNPFVD